MEARLIAFEDRLRQTEEVLVAERLARQTAEAAQQTVGPQPAGAGGGGERPPGLPSLVDKEAIGKNPTFSGDVDVNGQPEGMAWSQWSFLFRGYLGAFDSTATRLLRQVETNVEDPVVVDNTGMTEVERRLSIQLFFVLALFCRGKALQVVQGVPEGFGFGRWKQLCREFEPCLPSRFQGMLQALLSPTRMDDLVQTIYQRDSRVKVYEEQSGDRVSENIKLAVLQKYLCDGELALPLEAAVSTPNDVRSGSQGKRSTSRGRRLEGRSPWTCHRSTKEEAARRARARAKVTSQRNRKCFNCGKPGHNKGRNLFSPTRVVGTPVWKCILRQARENLLKGRGRAR